MKIIPERSTYQTATLSGKQIQVTNKQFKPFPKGVNKAAEYSWFYILAVQGNQGEQVTIKANYPSNQSPTFTRQSSLVFYSRDGWQWDKLASPVATDHDGLTQQYQFTFPTTDTYLISNTIFYDYDAITTYLQQYAVAHTDLCALQTIGQSLQGRDLTILSFPATQKSRGRILVTTGCHPAEPDLICSQAILDYLATPAALPLRQHYDIDIMPLQNPDGAATRSCLTSNGINLYWNFRKDDPDNCPEAFHLWQYITKHPPLLYLDFHAYVHQYHRPPMPYLKARSRYIGRFPKQLVKEMDRQLIKIANGYYKIGTISMWPAALSTYITKSFNTIAYTKYHVNLNEGVPASRQHAEEIFRQLANIALAREARTATVLKAPTGNVTSDHSDTLPKQHWYNAFSRLQQLKVYIKLYTRYYRIKLGISTKS